MGKSLNEVIKQDVKRMINSVGRNEKGNILPLIVGEIEKIIITLALEETSNNFVKTSLLLGIGRSTLYRKINLLNIIVEKSTKIDSLDV